MPHRAVLYLSRVLCSRRGGVYLHTGTARKRPDARALSAQRRSRLLAAGRRPSRLRGTGASVCLASSGCLQEHTQLPCLRCSPFGRRLTLLHPINQLPKRFRGYHTQLKQTAVCKCYSQLWRLFVATGRVPCDGAADYLKQAMCQERFCVHT